MGGILNAVIEGDPPSLDLHQVETYQTVYPVAPAVNLLVQFDPHDHTKVIPDLAQTWDISPDNKTYTFHLVRNAKFHHGKPMKSEDIKASFDRIMNPPQGINSPRKESFASVEGIDTPDDYTVRFILKRPTPSLLAIIAQGWNAIYPKDLLDAKGNMKSDLVGTGPFKLKNYQRGTSVELVKNPEYHVAGRPYLDGITYYVIPDPNTVFSAFVNGQLMIWRYTVKPDMDELKRQLGDKVRITKVSDQSTHVMEINAKRKPWDDVRVRQAVSLAIDRQAAVNIVTKGEGVITGVMAPGGQWALSNDELLKLPGYGTNKADDLARAKQLLADAGYSNGLKITLLTRKGPQYEPVSVFLKDQLTRIGLDASLDVRESAAFYEATDKREFDGLGASYSTAVDDPDAVFGQSWVSTASRNYSGVGDKAFDDLYAKQSEMVDVAQRKAIVQQMETHALTQVFKAVLSRKASWDMQWTRVQNFKAHNSQYLSQRHEGTWLADG
jgi:peptide/nickel transport system substrate-binding protein